MAIRPRKVNSRQWLTVAVSVSLALCFWLSGFHWNSERGVDGIPLANAVTLVKQTPIEFAVHLGTETGELKFVPNDITVQVGKRYKLILDNPSPQKHYFTAKDFADGIWTQKVDAGNVEIKGAIHELELKSGAIADWVFIPLKPGAYELHCSIPGHAAAGMTGTITVSET